MKKAAKGDPTAIAELAGYMQKAQEYQSKLEDAKGEMSAAQWAEFNKINAKLHSRSLHIHRNTHLSAFSEAVAYSYYHRPSNQDIVRPALSDRQTACV